MSKHTLGPWEPSKAEYKDGAGWYRRIEQTFLGGDVIGSVCIRHAGNQSLNESGEANARLIAAAPELLFVAKDFRQKLATYVNVYPGDKELRSLLAACDAAIAKAEGQS